MKNESVSERELARFINNLIGIAHLRVTSDAPRLVLLCTQAVRENQGRFLLAMLMREIDVLHWAMHAGWPLADDTMAALYAHPQLYVDIGVIDYAFPRKQFSGFLHRLIDAGFENRIMFGSDEMVWPDAISSAIDTIQNDPALSSGQKRDILYNNAARFLRSLNRDKGFDTRG
jgi:hypothetical protein